MNICGYIKESINEGEGLRAVVFISGCKHNCKGCHSAYTHDFNYGEEFGLEKQLRVISDIKNNPLLDGITLCGGDPFFSSQEVLQFILLLKKYEPNVNVWCYTGFTFEQLIVSKNINMKNLLIETDVLIDGKFKEELKDLTLKFRGSSNQRIIDVQESLKQNKIILYMD